MKGPVLGTWQQGMGPELLRGGIVTSGMWRSRIGSSRAMAAGTKRKFKKLMCCNRGEIAIRVFRAATELGMRTVGVYAQEDRHSLHRYKCDESYQLADSITPVGAYLDINNIIGIAKDKNVDAIHPGYGFLSENSNFAKACEENGITFVGPQAKVLRLFGDKTEARKLAIDAKVSIVPGSPGPITNLEEAREFVEGKNGIGFPVIVKAAHGGGGRGMRVVFDPVEFSESVSRAQSEAEKAFGDGTVFIERFVHRPRHIEVQVLADGTGDVVHLYERDCSVQRRHQKVVEIAPATGLPDKVRETLWNDSVRLIKNSAYKNAGTVEFLIDQSGRHYFIEVNPRVQVEHTVTEEVTGIDVVQSQIRIAQGETLKEIGLEQDKIQLRGYAIQCRVTTENPANNFLPDYGRIDAFRPGEGMGIRLDSAAGFAGAVVTPHYDSLLIKVTAHALDFTKAAEKLRRALLEFRVRGVHTNIPFLKTVLNHPVFLKQQMATDFIDAHPELFVFPPQRDRANKILRFLAENVVNGHPMPGPDKTKEPSQLLPVMPIYDPSENAPNGWKQVIDEGGPEGFANAVRKFPYTLLGDTTWRDAHQSLLATRMRTVDMASIAPATSRAFSGLYAIECWGGATFDVCMRFLREDPWQRLHHLRNLVPNIPFQMLLRGANAVGYTSYPDNLVYEFCKHARQGGVDVFRVFDSLNYVDNLLIGMDAVHKADGVVQGEICYSGDVKSTPRKDKYGLDYYLNIADQLVNKGNTHVLGIKDMAGLLKPESARELVGALRKEFPNTPIHVHTHDTAGVGVASMLACAEAGADIVHGAIDSMSGTTSQPPLGSIMESLRQKENWPSKPVKAGKHAIHLPESEKLFELHDYWDTMRGHYAPFEQGARSTSVDVFEHEMPGGQYTNLMFQSQSLGLAKQWKEVKKAYADANRILGKIVKVTPSSKVVGDLAQFMVTNKLSGDDIVERADSLDLPRSVVEFLQGQLGFPYGGFPEPLRGKVLRRAQLEPLNTRPGENLPPLDFKALKERLVEKFESAQKHGLHISDMDVVSAALYPSVFDDFKHFQQVYSEEVTHLPTNVFMHPMEVGQEFFFSIEEGKRLYVKLLSVSEQLDASGRRDVYFALNGVPRLVKIADREAAKHMDTKPIERIDSLNPAHVGASMPGTVVDIRTSVGKRVEKGEPLVVLSAMKMETVIAAPRAGRIKRIVAEVGNLVANEDLLIELKLD
eukprot:CAMPEP_0184740986 /NCGR_PEP_ID=MMETSP0315-20130426/4072_1 /TAXON_ID=101924 /ORGANISM="Rhodosorus marinus, Strain UTEX LB 2760" /LENGTH=1218 /DNA_ID=CAMNT_0027211065 /DNA_START=35 /DNA_END=3691 /DNA_ORIENTATION=-